MPIQIIVVSIQNKKTLKHEIYRIIQLIHKLKKSRWKVNQNENNNKKENITTIYRKINGKDWYKTRHTN